MDTKASIFGHPLHALLIPVPIGAFVVTLVFDALYVWAGTAAWWLGGTVAASVGALVLLVAIIPGLIDYVASVPKRGVVRVYAGVHMVLGLALTGYWLGSAVVHALTGPDPGMQAGWSSLVYSAVGLAFLAAQGWLGASLSHRFHVGVREELVQHLPPPGRDPGAAGRPHGPTRRGHKGGGRD